MEMILLDWTRMGNSYCLAGVVLDDFLEEVVRPLPMQLQGAPVRNVGWSLALLGGHQRWEVFELVDRRQPTEAERPHVEDAWVRELRPLGRSASPEQRRSILSATACTSGPPFGAPLTPTRTGAYLQPGTGERSLVTVHVPTCRITFGAFRYSGSGERHIRVTLPVGKLGERVLAVTDHRLLRRAEQVSEDIDRQVDALHLLVHKMGERVAVRLGLSRPFQHNGAGGEPRCWLMADGFFSLADPQP
jgi:hypothetical protein